MKRVYIGAALATLMLGGCAGESASLPDKKTLSQGLTILSEDVSGSLTAAYVKGDQVIYLETRRGPKVEEAVRRMYPDAPEYELDARIMDAKGRPIMERFGGHGAMDPLWAATEAKEDIVDVDERHDAIRLGWDAAEALKVAKLPRDLALHEGDALIQLARSVSEKDLFGEAPKSETAETKYVSSFGYNHKIEIHKKCLDFGCVFGDHSATWTKSYRNSDNAFLQEIITCNHGGCANDADMTTLGTNCPRLWDRRPNQMPTVQECSTPYSWSSSTDGHNCNDDSELQYANSKFNQTYGTGSGGYPSCFTNGLHNFKPDCDNDGQTLFWTSSEAGNVTPTWSNTVEMKSGVSGYLGPTYAPEAAIRTGEQSYEGGSGALMFSGNDDSATSSYAFMKVYDVNIAIKANMMLFYRVFPQQANAKYVAVDFIMTDGSSMRDNVNVKDQWGVRIHPQTQGAGGHLVVNQWTEIQVNLTPLAGKTIDRINIGYDQPAGTGQYRGYFDLIEIRN